MIEFEGSARSQSAQNDALPPKADRTSAAYPATRDHDIRPLGQVDCIGADCHVHNAAAYRAACDRSDPPGRSPLHSTTTGPPKTRDLQAVRACCRAPNPVKVGVHESGGFFSIAGDEVAIAVRIGLTRFAVDAPPGGRVGLWRWARCEYRRHFWV